MVFHATLLKSLRFFLVFEPNIIMPSFGWSLLTLLFPSPPVPLSILWWLDRTPQLQLVSPSLSCSIVFQFSSKVHVLIFSFSFSFTQWSIGTAKFTIWQFLFFFLTIITSRRLTEIMCSVCISKYQRSLRVSFSRTEFGLCMYLFLYGQILASCTIPNWSPSLPSHV